MPNPVISAITIPVRKIEPLRWLGTTTTNLIDNSAINPISVEGVDVTASTGDVVQYGIINYLWNGSVWQKI